MYWNRKNCTSVLKSASMDIALDRSSGLSIGTKSSKMVSSGEVDAFWHAPNSAPMLSKNLTMS
jgi:hypothetical protein